MHPVGPAPCGEPAAGDACFSSLFPPHAPRRNRHAVQWRLHDSLPTFPPVFRPKQVFSGIYGNSAVEKCLHEVYWERHIPLDSDGNTLFEGVNWRWADFDSYRKRIVYAENGTILALGLKLPLEPKLLYDFNGMTYCSFFIS